MKNYMLQGIVGVLFFLMITSCEEYLDAAPESILTEESVFANFNNAQGWVEETQSFVVDYQTSGHAQTDYVYGDDGKINTAWQPSNNIDQGNLTFWVRNSFSYLDGGRTDDPTRSNPYERPGVWDGSLRGIRKTNVMIENIDLMVDATQAERDVILGQCLFLRAFFHMEIMKFWGRYPYIDRVLPPDDNQLPRPATFKEPALAAYEDFMRAAELLPVNWDDQPYGQRTLGNNIQRITKGAAYAYAGKILLLAASPLMRGTTDTYDYDSELAALSADAFAEVFKLGDQGRYALEPFDNYEQVFWNVPRRSTLPGGSEYIFTAPGHGFFVNVNVIQIQMDRQVAGGDSKVISPTHNFIHHNFGMANGLSIQDDISGQFGTPTYDPTRPFENRDPRFYKWITVDGDVLATRGPSIHMTAKLYEGGTHRNRSSGSETGYFFKKFYPTLHSRWNNIQTNFTPFLLKMRYTDIYLMYAEALHAATGSATTAPASYNLTAEQAINALRQRAGVPNVHPAIVGNANKFMDEVRRDRSVELSWEAKRWTDIRRWSLAHLPLYKTKTGINFPEKDEETGTYAFIEEFTLVNRVAEFPKHFWLPFPPSETQLYEGFPQNPGW
ncbi:MAG: RagB/SusD family nutrient uptake outer membrane protein [Leeuwenhoekiella sp.]